MVKDSVTFVTLFDCNHEFLGTLSVPNLPEIPAAIVRGPRVFMRLPGSTNYYEQFAYFAPVAPLFLW